MFKDWTDKEKAEWLRDNLDKYWAERYPAATLNGKACDLLIDVEQQNQIEQTLRLVNTQNQTPRVDVSTGLAAMEDVRARFHKLSNEIMRVESRLELELDKISPKEEKIIIPKSLIKQVDVLQDRVDDTDHKIKLLADELVQFKKMTLRQRLRWLITGE